MIFSVKHIAICISYCSICVICAVTYEKITYFSVERPHIEYTNTKYVSLLNITSRRFNRLDPVYYFNLHFRNNFAFGSNFTFHFYFYEFLTNVYKPSFVEIHIKGCNMLMKEPVFGIPTMRALKKIDPNVSCPIPPGDWNLQNCTVNAAVLINFPFPKGRIIANWTYNPNGELVAGGYIDFQIKQMKIKKS